MRHRPAPPDARPGARPVQAKPDFDLDIMTKAQGLTGITTVLTRLEPVLTEVARWTGCWSTATPSTTMAATIAAFYQKILVGHVEAGLRPATCSSPGRRKRHRRVTDSIAAAFAPTEGRAEPPARERARRASTSPATRWSTALREVVDMIATRPALRAELDARFPFPRSGQADPARHRPPPREFRPALPRPSRGDRRPRAQSPDPGSNTCN